MDADETNEALLKALADRPLELRNMESALQTRLEFMRLAGVTFKGQRDLYQVLGYDRDITAQQHRDRYARGGIAGTVVDAIVDACWRQGFDIIEDQNPDNVTAFEQAWIDISQRLQLQNRFVKVDRLSRLGSFSVLLLGVKGGDGLDSELPRGSGPNDLIYMKAFSGGGSTLSGKAVVASLEGGASILNYVEDKKSPNYGKPEFYQLRRTSMLGPSEGLRVHHSRVIHVAENTLEDDVFGTPALERVWNDLDNLEKVAGGGSEAFWLRANQGLHADIDKDMDLPNVEKTLAALQEKMDDYRHGMTRWLRTRGVKVDTLGSDVANFSQPVDAILTLISGASRIPKRILTGSEQGELASSQDRDNWKDQVKGRQTNHIASVIIRQTIDRLIEYNYLPTPTKNQFGYDVVWPTIQTLTEQEKSAGAKDWADTNQKNGGVVFLEAEIRDQWYGMKPLTPQQVKDEQARTPAPVLPGAPADPNALANADKNAAFRAEAAHRNTSIHLAADSQVHSMRLAVQYAFAEGRRSLSQLDETVDERAAKRVYYTLMQVMPGVIFRTLQRGGDLSLLMLRNKTSDTTRSAAGPIDIRFDVQSQKAIKWAKTHAAELATQISDTTRKQIRSVITETLKGNKTLEDAQTDIARAVGDDARATTIARHETMTAASEGQRQAWDQAVEKGLLSEDSRKTWIATDGACEYCEELDGETVGIDEEYPDDGGDGPPLHVGCRCTEGIV